eukprot:snap_masked-scaffold367_size194084-processed-gene-0.2 protein:Tk00498 transcript:snap_masked-scaffold367_size194084-processed-gene-0.2-mRNA-1 annotation:"-like protein 3-like protein"
MTKIILPVLMELTCEMRYFPNPYPDFDPENQSSTPCPRDRILGRMARICADFDPGDVRRSLDGGLYLGASGLAYALWYVGRRLGQSSEYNAQAKEWLSYQLDWVKNTFGSMKGAEGDIGFLIGNAGTFAMAAVLGQELDDPHFRPETFLQSIQHMGIQARTGSMWEEVLVGRAGYLGGILWLRRHSPNPDSVMSEMDMLEIGRMLIHSGQSYARKTQSPCPLMYHYHGTEYLGAAHGLCSILQMILSIPNYQRVDPDGLVEQALNYLLLFQSPSGNFPCAMDELPNGGKHRPESEELVHWCHGAPGTIYLMASAYLVFKSRIYLDSALKCGECIWHKGLLKKGPGLCHGVAGNGYAFLLLYRLTQDEKHLYRAHRFAEFMESDTFQQGAKIPDCPHSLYEGTAGALCFLADLLDPKSATFPFFDLF